MATPVRRTRRSAAKAASAPFEEVPTKETSDDDPMGASNPQKGARSGGTGDSEKASNSKLATRSPKRGSDTAAGGPIVASPPRTRTARRSGAAEKATKLTSGDDDNDPSSASPASSTPLSPREVRKLRRDMLRSKATGMLSGAATAAANLDSPPKNKIIVFDDPDSGPAARAVPEAFSDKDNDEAGTAESATATSLSDGPRQASDGASLSIIRTHNEGGQTDDDDDDDDDAVEEMPSKIAREEDQKRRELERMTAKEKASLQATAKKARRKRNANREKTSQSTVGPDPQQSNLDSVGDEEASVEPAAEEITDMDESFFALLDEARAAERRDRKKRRLFDGNELPSTDAFATKRPPRGTHTTFIVEGESAASHSSSTRQVDSTVQVVVLPRAPGPAHPSSSSSSRPAVPVPTAPAPASAYASEPVSQAALVYSRSLLVDGSDVMSAKEQQKARRNGVSDHFKDGVVPGWKRSKKMGCLGGKHRRKRSMAAPIFVVKK